MYQLMRKCAPGEQYGGMTKKYACMGYYTDNVIEAQNWAKKFQKRIEKGEVVIFRMVPQALEAAIILKDKEKADA